MQIPPDLPAAARDAIEQGKLWRAKEVLSGRLGTFGYSTERYEQYGYVLLRMQDLPEAGRFLFLSGARRAEYEPAIEAFLHRHARNPRALLAAFPKSARSCTLAELPATVAEELRKLGIVELPARATRQEVGVGARTVLNQRLAVFGCVAILAFAAASAIAGIPVILRLVVSLFR